MVGKKAIILNIENELQLVGEKTIILDIAHCTGIVVGRKKSNNVRY